MTDTTQMPLGLNEALGAGLEGASYRFVANLYFVSLFLSAPFIAISVLFWTQTQAIALSAGAGAAVTFFILVYHGLESTETKSRLTHHGAIGAAQKAIDKQLEEAWVFQKQIYSLGPGAEIELILRAALRAADRLADEKKRSQLLEALAELAQTLAALAQDGNEEYAVSIAELVSITIETSVGGAKPRVVDALFESLRHVIMEADEECQEAAVADALDRLVARLNDASKQGPN